jgi:hypothetical protein
MLRKGNKLKYFIILLLVSLFAIGGCGSKDGATSDIMDTWEMTKDVFDPPPSIDTDSYQMDNPNRVRLARLFAPVDGPLTSLSRFVESTDILPDIDWLELLMARFPWVNTVMVTDEEGNILFMQPETPLKKLTQPLIFKAEWRDRPLLTRVDYTDLGPEMYIGRPYFKDTLFRGLIGVGFDPRTLLSLSPEPTKLVVIQPGKGVFSRGKADAEALLAVNWDEILVNYVNGQVEAGGKYYTWIVRYIGKDPYIYATESVEADTDDGWFF